MLGKLLVRTKVHAYVREQSLYGTAEGNNNKQINRLQFEIE
jgi:hypothetical protein